MGGGRRRRKGSGGRFHHSNPLFRRSARVRDRTGSEGGFSPPSDP